MKKLYLLLAASVLICGTTMAQLQNDLRSYRIDNRTDAMHKVKMNNNMQKDEAIWTCTFEEETPLYTLIKTDGTGNDWQLMTEADYPSTILGTSGQGYYFWPMNFSGHQGWSTSAYQISETPAHWMLMDLITPSRADGDLSCDASIVFSNIDLSACAAPKLTFLQSYRVLNEAGMTMQISTSVDGGANWTDHVVNNGTYETYDYVDGLVEVLIPEAGGHNSVTIRINVQNNAVYGSGEYGVNYGWQVDDVKIVEAPSHNLSMTNARISMFGYLDYRDYDYLSQIWSNMEAAEKPDYAYQIYDPYAQTPKDQWETSGGYAAFNVEYTNNGAVSATPKVNIVVTSPSGTEIYNKTLTGRALASTAKDTIDFGTIDDDNMANSTIFYFEDEIELGRYTVTFTISEDGAEDSNLEDNTLTQYFDITEKNYSKAYYEPSSTFGVKQYTICQSGDMFGTSFLYFYSPDDIMSADLYIADGTTTGGSTSVNIHLFKQNDEGEYVEQRQSGWEEITDEMINTWTNFTFTNEYPFQFEESEQYRELTVVVEVSYDGEDDNIYLGKSTELATRAHQSMEYFSARETWYYGSSDIALSFHAGEGVEVSADQNVAEGIDMYPNPSNGIVNFTNVENATIEVYNMMGQVVASMSNASENASIDLSGVAKGNYIVRIVKDGAISTSKLNIVK
jgi:hypothetical protein